MSRPPLFILGAPRSGTSLLYKALCLHPGATYLSNWHRRAILQRAVPVPPAWAVLNRLPRRVEALSTWAWFGRDGNAYVYGTKRRAARLVPMPVEGEPLFTRFGFGWRDVGPGRGAELADYCQRMVRSSGGQVLVNKRIDHNRRIARLLACFPDARFVVVARDGRAVAASLARVDWWPTADLWWADTTPAAWVARGGDPWEACARHWVEEVRAIRQGLTAVDPSQVLHVSYAAVAGRTSFAVGEVAGFAGLDEDPRWRRRLDQLAYPPRDRNWSARLDADAIATIEAITSPELGRSAAAA